MPWAVTVGQPARWESQPAAALQQCLQWPWNASSRSQIWSEFTACGCQSTAAEDGHGFGSCCHCCWRCGFRVHCSLSTLLCGAAAYEGLVLRIACGVWEIAAAEGVAGDLLVLRPSTWWSYVYGFPLFGIFACKGVQFTHDSPQRGDAFAACKILSAWLALLSG